MMKFVSEEEKPNSQTGNTMGTGNHEQIHKSKIKTVICLFIRVFWTMVKAVSSYSMEFVTSMIIKEEKSTLAVQPSDSNITQETNDFKHSSIQECTDRSEDIYINSVTIPCRDFQRTEASWLNNDGLLLNPSETENLKTVTQDESEIHVNSLVHYKENGCSKEELNKFCYPLGENFKGWLEKDKIESGLKEGYYLIENRVPGVQMKHCTALHVERNQFEYFDSLGNIFTKNISIPVNNNEKRFQHHGYNTCGLHATYFLKQRYKLGSMEKALNSYPTDEAEMLELNEEHVYNYT